MEASNETDITVAANINCNINSNTNVCSILLFFFYFLIVSPFDAIQISDKADIKVKCNVM